MFFPIWAAFLITLNFTVPSFRSKHFSTNLTLISTGICTVYSALILYLTSTTGIFINNDVIEWLKIDNSYFGFGFFLDNLSALFLVIFNYISLFIQIYSYEYMKNDECFHRFFVYLNLFGFSITGLLISTNLIQSYMFLVLVSVFTYLLSSFWFKKNSVSKNSKSLFTINFLGDCSFFLGLIFMVYFALYYYAQEDFSTLNFSTLYDLSQSIIPYSTDLGFFIICLFIGLPVILKSAQIPFQRWIFKINSAPAPVITIVNSISATLGIYLLVRLLPMFNMSVWMMKLFLYLGIFSALTSAVLGVFQTNLKKILSYFLSSQLGLIIAAICVFSTSQGLFHLTTTIFAIILLFLIEGIIKSILNEDNINYMGELRRSHPYLCGLWLIAILSASGLFFSGIFSFTQLWESFLSKGMLTEFIIIIVISMINAFNLFKTYYYIFEKKKEPLKLSSALNFEIKLPIKIALFMVLLPTMFFGILTFKKFFLLFDINSVLNFSTKGFLLSFSMVFFGAVFGILYAKFVKRYYGKEVKLPDNIFERKIYKPICEVFEFFDKTIALIPKFIKLIIKILSVIISKLQTRSVQTYLLGSFLGIILAIAFIVFYYLKLRGY